MDLHMLSTEDNPYSPVTHYDQWLTWDMARYNSNALLARVTYTSADLSETDQALAIEQAIDDIVRENVSGVHIKVKAGTLEQAIEVDTEVEVPRDKELAA